MGMWSRGQLSGGSKINPTLFWSGLYWKKGFLSVWRSLPGNLVSRPSPTQSWKGILRPQSFMVWLLFVTDGIGWPLECSALESQKPQIDICWTFHTNRLHCSLCNCGTFLVYDIKLCPGWVTPHQQALLFLWCPSPRILSWMDGCNSIKMRIVPEFEDGDTKSSWTIHSMITPTMYCIYLYLHRNQREPSLPRTNVDDLGVKLTHKTWRVVKALTFFSTEKTIKAKCSTLSKG